MGTNIENKSFAGVYREEIGKFKGKLRLFLRELISTVNFADNPDFIFENQPYPLKRGQLITSRKELAKLTGYSEQTIRTLLANLEKLKILTYHSTGILTNRATLITFIEIDKWLVKQGELTNQLTNQLTNDQPTPNQRVTTNNNDNNKEEGINKKYKTVSIFLKDKESIIPKVEELYLNKDVKKAWVDFEAYITTHNTKYKDFYLAFANWVREDRYQKYNLSANRRSAKEKEIEAFEAKRKQAENVFTVERNKFFDQKYGEGTWSLYQLPEFMQNRQKKTIISEPDKVEFTRVFAKKHPELIKLLKNP